MNAVTYCNKLSEFQSCFDLINESHSDSYLDNLVKQFGEISKRHGCLFNQSSNEKKKDLKNLLELNSESNVYVKDVFCSFINTRCNGKCQNIEHKSVPKVAHKPSQELAKQYGQIFPKNDQKSLSVLLSEKYDNLKEQSTMNETDIYFCSTLYELLVAKGKLLESKINNPMNITIAISELHQLICICKTTMDERESVKSKNTNIDKSLDVEIKEKSVDKVNNTCFTKIEEMSIIENDNLNKFDKMNVIPDINSVAVVKSSTVININHNTITNSVKNTSRIAIPYVRDLLQIFYNSLYWKFLNYFINEIIFMMNVGYTARLNSKMDGRHLERWIGIFVYVSYDSFRGKIVIDIDDRFNKGYVQTALEDSNISRDLFKPTRKIDKNLNITVIHYGEYSKLLTELFFKMDESRLQIYCGLVWKVLSIFMKTPYCRLPPIEDSFTNPIQTYDEVYEIIHSEMYRFYKDPRNYNIGYILVTVMTVIEENLSKI